MSRWNQRQAQIKGHLFVISPNNSGSTLLKNLLATSSSTWNLQNEGQNTFGFVGPRSRTTIGPFQGQEARALPPLTWAAEAYFRTVLTDASRYDWPRTRQAWYLQAFSSAPETASIFVEKSPFFILNVAALQANFDSSKFLFLVRNPYAVVQGIAKRQHLRRFLNGPDADLTEVAARHIVECLRVQRENCQRFANVSCLLGYEDLCERPAQVAQAIQALQPELSDLDLRQAVAVKGLYNEPPRNMNRDQIAQLSTQQFEIINRVFESEQALLAWFGYALLSSVTDLQR